jgi:NAD(P)-dependent dehydrogenase (short-subunit alcohol dehydrogenase family)
MSEILDGKVAIVTGAAKGLGHQIARRLDEAGATVVLSDLLGAHLTSAAGELGAGAIACDVRDEAEVQQLVADTVARHGHLDVMVACAGVATVKPLAQMSLAEWREVLSVDLDGVFLCTKHAGDSDGRQRRRVDHQHRLDQGVWRRSSDGPLWCCEGRRGVADQDCGA